MFKRDKNVKPGAYATTKKRRLGGLNKGVGLGLYKNGPR